MTDRPDPETGRPGKWSYFNPRPVVYLLPIAMVACWVAGLYRVMLWVWANLPRTIAALMVGG